MRSVFDGEPAGLEETREFVKWMGEFGDPDSEENKTRFYMAQCADRVFILHTRTFHCIMTNKHTLMQLEPLAEMRVEAPPAPTPPAEEPAQS